MAQGLHQALHAIHMFRGAQEYRHDQIVGEILGHMRIDILLLGNRVFQQLFQQVVVEIGQ